MHEMSLATEICRITAEQVGEEEAGRVVEVGVEVGDDAGVEPDSLLFWLEILLQEPPFRAALPRIHRVKGSTLSVSYLEVRDDDSTD